MASTTQTKNVYWCDSNVFSGWTSLYFKPDPIMHIRIKYVGVGNWQYTGDGTWYIISKLRERVLTNFVTNGYRVKEITAQEAEGRKRVHNARKNNQSRSNERTRYNRQQEEERERKRKEEEANRRERETSDAFSDFFNREFSRTVSTKSFKDIEDAWLTIFYSIKPEQGRKLHRQAVLVLHQDITGDPELIKPLNTAWEYYNDPKRRRR